MRALLTVLFAVPGALAAGPVRADEPSNPAFLGVSMRDMGPTGPCVIGEITPDSGAQMAGMQQDDTVLALDDNAISNCDSLVKGIQAREPGQPVKIRVQRSGAVRILESNLPSRGDVLRKRFVGKQLPLATLMRVDERSASDLTSRGKTTIVGWYDQSTCVSCASAFSNITDWVKSKGKSTISVVGVTSTRLAMPEAMQNLKEAQRKLDVPLMYTDPVTFTELSINDAKRIHFMVIDCRGIVAYATPLKPDADDRTAVLEELYAATEQAARRMK